MERGRLLTNQEFMEMRDKLVQVGCIVLGGGINPWPYEQRAMEQGLLVLRVGQTHSEYYRKVK